MLEWTSESEYFENSEIFLQTIYIIYPGQEQSLTPRCACTGGGGGGGGG